MATDIRPLRLLRANCCSQGANCALPWSHTTSSAATTTATTAATGEYYCYYCDYHCHYEALLLPLRLLLLLLLLPLLLRLLLLRQLFRCTRFDHKLHRHAVSQNQHPQTDRLQNHSTASCTASHVFCRIDVIVMFLQQGFNLCMRTKPTAQDAKTLLLWQCQQGVDRRWTKIR